MVGGTSTAGPAAIATTGGQVVGGMTSGNDNIGTTPTSASIHSTTVGGGGGGNVFLTGAGGRAPVKDYRNRTSITVLVLGDGTELFANGNGRSAFYCAAFVLIIYNLFCLLISVCFFSLLSLFSLFFFPSFSLSFYNLL